MPRKHPHPGRLAEVYRRNPDWPTPGAGPAFLWTGIYTAGPDHADHPAGAIWNDELQAWVTPSRASAGLATSI